MGARITHLPLGIAFSLLVGALPGQELIAIPASHVNREGSTSTNVPFGRPGPMRAQLVYDRSLFPGPLEISEVSFRGNGGEVALAKQVDVELRMSTLSGSILVTQQQFESNRGVDEVVVLDRRVLTLPDQLQVQVPNPFHLRLPLDRSFAYDPAAGSLVLEVIVHDQEPGPYSLDTTYVCASPPEAIGPSTGASRTSANASFVSTGREGSSGPPAATTSNARPAAATAPPPPPRAAAP